MAAPAKVSPNFWERPDLDPLWRALLARDGDDGAALRRWVWWSWWATKPTAKARRAAVRDLVRAPLIFSRQARGMLAEHGPRVVQRHRITRWRQLAQMTWLWLRHGTKPLSYYRFQLFLPDRWRRAGRYLQTDVAEDLIQIVIPRTPQRASDTRRFVDKRAFRAWSVQHGIPSVPTLMEFDAGRLVEKNVESLPAQDLFSKPGNWQGGQRVRRWRYADGRWDCGDGVARTAEEVTAEVARESAELGRPVLLQPGLSNHPALRPLTPGGLCTIRLVTVRPIGGEPQAVVAVYRMPTGKAAADNFDGGGLAAPVDMKTGELGAAVQKKGALPVDEVDVHPDTGAKVRGFKVPFFHEAVALGVRAHALSSPRVPVIGWDIAIVDDGPLIVEANNVPCSVLAQMPTGLPLGETVYTACLTSHLREAFGLPRRDNESRA
jgi:hypothetical protein